MNTQNNQPQINKLYINLPKDLDASYNVSKINFSCLKEYYGKSFFEITKAHLPIIELSKYSNQFSDSESNNNNQTKWLCLNLGLSNYILKPESIIFNKLLKPDKLTDLDQMAKQTNTTEIKYIFKIVNLSNSVQSNQTVLDLTYIENGLDMFQNPSNSVNLSLLDINSTEPDIVEIMLFIKLKLNVLDNKYTSEIEDSLIKLSEKINKYIKLEDINILKPYYSYLYDLENLHLHNDYVFYEYIYNNQTDFIKLIVENYFTEIQNKNDILPDIYLINGFTKNLPISNSIIHKKIHIIICSFVCFVCQLIAPLYYVSESFQDIFFNCMNKSKSIVKFFSLFFYVLMYIQFMTIWDDSLSIYKKFNKSYFIKNNLFIYTSLFINMLIAIIMPIFTYMIFTYDTTVLSLMWNSLLGIYLINLDNDFSKLLFGANNLKSFINNKLLISFINDGEKNEILNNNHFICYALKFCFILQSIITFILCVYLLFCM